MAKEITNFKRSKRLRKRLADMARKPMLLHDGNVPALPDAKSHERFGLGLGEIASRRDELLPSASFPICVDEIELSDGGDPRDDEGEATVRYRFRMGSLEPEENVPMEAGHLPYVAVGSGDAREYRIDFGHWGVLHVSVVDSKLGTFRAHFEHRFEHTKALRDVLGRCSRLGFFPLDVWDNHEGIRYWRNIDGSRFDEPSVMLHLLGLADFDAMGELGFDPLGASGAKTRHYDLPENASERDESGPERRTGPMDVTGEPYGERWASEATQSASEGESAGGVPEFGEESAESEEEAPKMAENGRNGTENGQDAPENGKNERKGRKMGPEDNSGEDGAGNGAEDGEEAESERDEWETGLEKWNSGWGRLGEEASKALESLDSLFDTEEVARNPQHELVKAILWAGVPLYLVGPAGCGKNHTVSAICEELDWDFYYTNCILQEYKLTGFIDAGGEFHETEFYRACSNGRECVFFLDEADASDPQAMLTLNAAIANGYYEFPVGRLDLGNVRFVAAGNTVGTGADDMYTGRSVLDQSTLDRFAVVHMGYDETVDRILAHDDNELVSMVHYLRDRASEQGVRATFSYRALEQSVALAEAGLDLKDVVRTVALRGLDRDTARTLVGGGAPRSAGRWGRALRDVVEESPSESDWANVPYVGNLA